MQKFLSLVQNQTQSALNPPNDHINHMNNHNENTHLIDTQEQYVENNDIDQDEFHYKTNDDLIPDK